MGRRQSPLLLLICAASSLGAAGCKRKAEAALVIGVEAQPAIASRMGKLHYSAKVGETLLVEKDIITKVGAPPPFPFEIPLEGAHGAQVDVVIEVFSAGLNNTVAPTPMLVRRLHAPFVRGPAKLVRLRLEGVCATNTPGFRGPACPPTQSCSNGRCIDPTLLPEDLEDYEKEWAKNRPDVCRPAHPGEPEVLVGTGQTDYGPLKEGDTLQPEKGPQGGHHLWIAARQKNLKQSGTIIAITAEQPGTGLKVPPTSFVFSFDPAGGGYCKLFGLRFQIDNSSVPVARFLGQPLEVKVSLRDPDGRVAESKVRINVAATTIGD
jgi:hypothetical protein